MKKGDKILLLAVCLLFAAYLVSHLMQKDQSRHIVIYRNDSIVATLPLDRDTEYVVQGDRFYNKVTVKGGKAYMMESSCPNQLCVHAAPISRNGETIVCLPNHIIVACVGGEDSSYDVVTN